MDCAEEPLTTATLVEIQVPTVEIDGKTYKRMRQSLHKDAATCLHRLEHKLHPDAVYYSGVNMSIGTAYHAALEAYYLERKARGYFDPSTHEVNGYVESGEEAFLRDVEQAGDRFEWVYHPGTRDLARIVHTTESALEWVDKLVRLYFDEKHQWPSEYRVVDVERYWEMDFPDRPEWARTGTMDLVLRNVDDGWLYIVDHKTAKKPWQKNRGTPKDAQGAYYTDAARILYDQELVTFFYDVFETKKWTFDRRPAYRSEEVVEATIHQIQKTIDIIDNGGPFPPNPESNLCSPHYCSYWDACEFSKLKEQG